MKSLKQLGTIKEFQIYNKFGAVGWFNSLKYKDAEQRALKAYNDGDKVMYRNITLGEMYEPFKPYTPTIHEEYVRRAKRRMVEYGKYEQIRRMDENNKSRQEIVKEVGVSEALICRIINKDKRYAELQKIYFEYYGK